MAPLGHGKTSGQGEGAGVRKVFSLLPLRAQRQDATPEQPELYAELDGQTASRGPWKLPNN